MKILSKRAIISAVIVLLAGLAGGLAGCSGKTQDSTIVAKVNNYEMSIDDFKSDLETVFVNEAGTLSDEEVLDLAIKREILVQEAQKEGIDREKTFMDTIERYWKQALIKELLGRKSKEFSLMQNVSDNEKNKLMQDWYDNLYKKARIKKNAQALRGLK
jgi:peptidyl-prolyl cis-trans isomerase C